MNFKPRFPATDESFNSDWARGSECEAQKSKLVRTSDWPNMIGGGEAVQYKEQAPDEVVMQVTAGQKVSSWIQVMMDLGC